MERTSLSVRNLRFKSSGMCLILNSKFDNSGATTAASNPLASSTAGGTDTSSARPHGGVASILANDADTAR
jgi:hypothetical protein